MQEENKNKNRPPATSATFIFASSTSRTRKERKMLPWDLHHNYHYVTIVTIRTIVACFWWFQQYVDLNIAMRCINGDIHWRSQNVDQLYFPYSMSMYRYLEAAVSRPGPRPPPPGGTRGPGSRRRAASWRRWRAWGRGWRGRRGSPARSAGTQTHAAPVGSNMELNAFLCLFETSTTVFLSSDEFRE